jgi:predicted nucleic acid-binding Zn ribbon protein
MQRRFNHIKQDVSQLLAGLGVTSDTYAPFNVWEKEAGNLAAICREPAIKGTVLYVTVQSPVYAQELVLRKRELLRKINGHFTKKMLSDIRCIVESAE